MALTVQLTIVPKEPKKEEQGGESKPEEPPSEADEKSSPPTTDQDNGHEEEGDPNDLDHNDVEEIEMDMKDLEVSRQKKKKNDGNSSADLVGGSSNASINFKLSTSSRSTITHDPIDDDFYQISVTSTGKYSRKATMEDIALFAGVEQVDSEVLKGWLHNYLEQNYPHQLEKPNCIPRSAHIQDDVKKGFSAFEPYGWKVIKLHLQPGLVEIKDQHTDEVTLERFQLNYSTDMEQALIEKGDKELVSSLKKGPLRGHPLAAQIFKKSKKLQDDLQFLTEFRGMDGVQLALGNNQCKGEQREATDELTWRDNKKLRALLHGKPFPKKTGKGVTRTVSVFGLETYMKARIYYKVSFTGSVSTDHGSEQFDGERYWNWDLKYLLRYNGIPNAQVLYQDVEVKFYTRIQYAMENEDWEWVNKSGTWVKQKLAEKN